MAEASPGTAGVFKGLVHAFACIYFCAILKDW